MTASIKWEGDNLRNFVKKAADEALNSAATDIQRQLARVTCPVHGGRAQVSKIKTHQGYELRAVAPCCDALRDAVKAAQDRALQQRAA